MHRTVTTQAMTADVPMVTVRPYWIRCSTCGLRSAEGYSATAERGYSNRAEAAHLAHIHDVLHHGGHPVAGLTRTP